MSQQFYKPLPMAPFAIASCVVSLLQQMMEKDRNKRPQTPQDLQKAILACLEEIRASSSRSGSKSGEAASDFETLDLSSPSGEPLAIGSVIAETYRLIEELVESPQGRKFVADDLRRGRRVSLLVLSQEFLSDSARLPAWRKRCNSCVKRRTRCSERSIPWKPLRLQLPRGGIFCRADLVGRPAGAERAQRSGSRTTAQPLGAACRSRQRPSSPAC